jgi:hypothetical protein
MRVEVFDGSGNRYTVTFEGYVTREKAIRLLDIVELLGGIPEEENPELLRSIFPSCGLLLLMCKPHTSKSLNNPLA